jgi:hypothetical protein
VFFLTPDGWAAKTWTQQTAGVAPNTYLVDDNAFLDAYITTPFWDWGVK